MEAVGLRVRLGRTEVLRGVDLAVPPGALYGLIGRNGAGKTTTLRCLLGFLPAYDGAARVWGHDARRLHEVPRPLGVALDPPGLDDGLTVRQNLELARIRGGIRGGRGVDEVLRLVRLTHRQHNRGDRLSHGQGRRAAVARALLGAPELLVLDEPLSGLDPEGVEELLDLFVRLTRDEGVTIVLSSHHLREVEHVCTHVGLLEDGATLLEGATADLLRRAGDRLVLEAGDVEAALHVLRAASGVREPIVLADGRVEARLDADFDAERVLADLVAGGARPRAFTRHHASLVQVFRDALARRADALAGSPADGGDGADPDGAPGEEVGA